MTQIKIKTEDLKEIIANIRKVMGEIATLSVKLSMIASALDKKVKE